MKFANSAVVRQRPLTLRNMLTGLGGRWEWPYLYSSPDVIRVIKCGRMRWAGRVERMGEVRQNVAVEWTTLLRILEFPGSNTNPEDSNDWGYGFPGPCGHELRLVHDTFRPHPLEIFPYPIIRRYVQFELLALSLNKQYVCVRGGPKQPLHRDLQWSLVLNKQ
jgi:hypothetical protein